MNILAFMFTILVALLVLVVILEASLDFFRLRWLFDRIGRYVRR